MMDFINENGLFIAAYSKTGPTHNIHGQGNQDRLLYGFSGDCTFFAALSDGVSSSLFAEQGSEVAVLAVKAVSDEIASGKTDISDTKELQTRIVKTWKKQFPSGWNDYAATLNFIIFHNNKVVIGRIGDGLIVFEIDGTHRVSSAEEEFYTSVTAALGETVSRKDFDIQLFSVWHHFSAYMTSDGIGKEIAVSHREDVNRYLIRLAQGSEDQIEQEIVQWVNVLDSKNGDDKTIMLIRWEDLSCRT